MANICVLTPTNRFCFTCEKTLRKAIFALTNGHDTEEILERLCVHTESHQNEARIRKPTMIKYEALAYGSDYAGPLIEVGQYEEADE